MVEPTRIGDLLVERVLGEGGMGRVLLCRDDALDRRVAVKTLLPALLHDEGMRGRFLREARALAKVKSPNVVTVHAVGEDAAVGPYVVMDLLDGDDVLALLRKRERFDVDEGVRVAAAACAGLAAAHDAGLLHRDVKPANLFVKHNGDVVLTDFGLAKEMPLAGDVKPPGAVDAVPAAQLTQQGVVVGTPAYLAPELARGQAPSVASDLYALGATLFHLLAGRPPFEGDAPLDVLSKAVLDAAPRLSSLRKDTPPHVDDAVARCLQKDPRDRPRDALALKTLLTTASSSPSAQSTQVLGTFAEPVSSLPPLVSSPSVPLPSSPSGANSTLSNPVSGSFAAASMEASSPGRVTVKTAALTVMMTDIAGYTERTSRQSREEAARWLALHDALLQPVFKAFSGKVVKTIGDAFLVTFASPTDAVHCGMAVQDRLCQHNVNAGEADRIEVKIALSMGEVRLHKGDIFGEPVNLAARLEGLAQKGEVLFSDAVFATMNQAEVKTEPRGTHSFKGISREVHVYAAVPDPTPGALPFGGRALSRVTTSPLQSVVNVALPLAAKARTQFEARPRAFAGVVVGVVLVVVVLALLLSGGRRGRIHSGEAQQVRAEIEKIPEADRSEADVVDLAVALHALDERKKAWRMLKKPIEGGLDDDDVKAMALKDLDDKDDAGAVDALAAFKDDASDDVRGLLSGPYWTRHHALDVLEAKKVATDDERADVGFLDVDEDDCGERRMGLWLLKRAGRGPKALSAVKALGSNMPANLCMALEVRGAEDAISKRK